jgi:hypothetical protein
LAKEHAFTGLKLGCVDDQQDFSLLYALAFPHIQRRYYSAVAMLNGLAVTGHSHVSLPNDRCIERNERAANNEYGDECCYRSNALSDHRPRVIACRSDGARRPNSRFRRILGKLGAHELLLPEVETGASTGRFPANLDITSSRGPKA